MPDESFKSTHLHFEYDEESDILYCSFGMPVEATIVEIEEGISIRKEERSKRIVGFTLANFTQRFISKNCAWTIPLLHESCGAVGV